MKKQHGEIWHRLMGPISEGFDVEINDEVEIGDAHYHVSAYCEPVGAYEDEPKVYVVVRVLEDEFSGEVVAEAKQLIEETFKKQLCEDTEVDERIVDVLAWYESEEKLVPKK